MTLPSEAALDPPRLPQLWGVGVPVSGSGKAGQMASPPPAARLPKREQKGQPLLLLLKLTLLCGRGGCGIRPGGKSLPPTLNNEIRT